MSDTKHPADMNAAGPNGPDPNAQSEEIAAAAEAQERAAEEPVNREPLAFDKTSKSADLKEDPPTTSESPETSGSTANEALPVKEEPSADAAKKPVIPASSSRDGKRVVDKRNRSLKRISVITTILFLVVVLIFNIGFDRLLGPKLKWDWSQGGQYTIGEVSQQILDEMDKKVELIGLFNKDRDSNYMDFHPLFEDYERRSGGKLTVRFVNPDVDPGILRTIDPGNKIAPKAGNLVVFSPDTQKAKVILPSEMYYYQQDPQTGQRYQNGIIAEQAISGAIKYVAAEVTPVVYFTSGLDETDYETSLSILSKELTNNNFDVARLEWIEAVNAGRVPEDCAVLVMNSPKKDINVDQARVLDRYLRAGGGLFLMTDFNASSYPELNKVLAINNIAITNDRVRETDRNYLLGTDPYVMLADIPAGQILPRTISRQTIVLGARAMQTLAEGKEYIKVEPLLTTSAQSVLETGGDTSKLSAQGTQTIGLASDNRGFIDGNTVKKSARVVAIGSSVMFSDPLVGQYGNFSYNMDVFYFSIQWLANLENHSVYIPRKMPVNRTVSGGSQSLNSFVAVLVVLIVPLLLLIAAMVVYRRRKHL